MELTPPDCELTRLLEDAASYKHFAGRELILDALGLLEHARIETQFIEVRGLGDVGERVLVVPLAEEPPNA